MSQPPPIKNTDGYDVWALLINHARRTNLGPGLVEAMQRRRERGLATYGTPLQPDNGRDHLLDAEEEVLDAYAYLYAEALLHPTDPQRAALVAKTLELLYRLHQLRMRGGGR